MSRDTNGSGGAPSPSVYVYSTSDMADIVAEIKKIPPVTRFLVLSSLGITVPAVLGLVPIHKLVFITPLVTKRWEVSTSTHFLAPLNVCRFGESTPACSLGVRVY